MRLLHERTGGYTPRSRRNASRPGLWSHLEIAPQLVRDRDDSVKHRFDRSRRGAERVDDPKADEQPPQREPATPPAEDHLTHGEQNKREDDSSQRLEQRAEHHDRVADRAHPARHVRPAEHFLVVEQRRGEHPHEHVGDRGRPRSGRPTQETRGGRVSCGPAYRRRPVGGASRPSVTGCRSRASLPCLTHLFPRATMMAT